MIEQFDEVRLKRDLPEHNLKMGAVGAVVDVHTGSPSGFEVEFSDPDREGSFFTVGIRSEDVEPVE